MSRKHRRGRRGHALKQHLPAQQDDQSASSNSNEDTSQSNAEENDD